MVCYSGSFSGTTIPSVVVGSEIRSQGGSYSTGYSKAFEVGKIVEAAQKISTRESEEDDRAEIMAARLSKLKKSRNVRLREAEKPTERPKTSGADPAITDLVESMKGLDTERSFPTANPWRAQGRVSRPQGWLGVWEMRAQVCGDTIPIGGFRTWANPQHASPKSLRVNSPTNMRLKPQRGIRTLTKTCGSVTPRTRLRPQFPTFTNFMGQEVEMEARGLVISNRR